MTSASSAGCAALPEKEQLRLQWLSQFSQATQADSWGQIVEAQEEYQTMAASVAAKQSLPSITSREKDCMHRIGLCLSARVQALKTLNETISLVDMKALEPVFAALFTGNEPEIFPIDASKFQHGTLVKPSTDGEITCGDVDEGRSEWHQYQEVLKNVSGTVVSIRIDRIGLKDALEYIDPFMTVLVSAPPTMLLDTHDTPAAKERQPTYVIFDHQIYLNISYEDMQRQQAAIFFEFKHYKPKKKKTSTRCWAFMELNELIRDQEIVLELYHKPTDLKKKKLNLHTEKPLYLHLSASFTKTT